MYVFDYYTASLHLMVHKYEAAATKSNQVFLPALQNADKAEKLRSTLGVFERSKFFFNLPSTLMEYINAVCLKFLNSVKNLLKTLIIG